MYRQSAHRRRERMKVYDEHGQPYPPPQEPRRDGEPRRNDGPQEPQEETVDLGELLAGDT
jgi:hypothetical protein